MKKLAREKNLNDCYFNSFRPNERFVFSKDTIYINTIQIIPPWGCTIYVLFRFAGWRNLVSWRMDVLTFMAGKSSPLEEE